MELIKKRALAKIYLLFIFVKGFFFRKKVDLSTSISTVFQEFSNKKKIVVLCNGPSALKHSFSKENLYLVTNNGKDLVKNLDFLYYVNDGFYIRKILAQESYLKQQQHIIFYFEESSELHKKGLSFLLRNICLLSKKKLIFFTNGANFSTSNFDEFKTFYLTRKLPVKIQNSGVFLLLLGYYLSVRQDLPLEIYGLDLGIGGEHHFNKKGVIGKSVLNTRVKKNVKMYLDFMYLEQGNKVKNYSNFNTKY